MLLPVGPDLQKTTPPFMYALFNPTTSCLDILMPFWSILVYTNLNNGNTHLLIPPPLSPLPSPQGWICNSSICMTRRGLKPTGIAIYDALEQGFKSVGHLLQSQLIKRGGIAALKKGGGSGPCGCPADDSAAPSSTSDDGAAASGAATQATTAVTAQEGDAGAVPAVAAAAASQRPTRGRPPKAPKPAAEAAGPSPAAAAAADKVSEEPATAAAGPSAAPIADSPTPAHSDASLPAATKRPRGGRCSTKPSPAAASSSPAVASGRVCKPAVGSTSRATRSTGRSAAVSP